MYLAHLLIETYYKTVIGVGQEVELEFSIPRPNIYKYTGYADIVNKTTGEIFEIKSIDGVRQGELEAQGYVEGGDEACPNTPAWHLGTNFPSEVRIPWPIDPFKKDLIVNRPKSGVIIYDFDEVNRTQPIPTIVPNSKRKDIEDLLTQIMQEVVQSPIVLTPLKLNQLILNKFRALTPNELKLALAGILVGTTAYFILNGVVSVGSGGTSIVAQIPLYAAGIAITAICLKIIDDNYQINSNDNYYSN